MSDLDILTTTRSWVATPWDYNSCIYLRFRADGSGDMVLGYGQAIIAKIKFGFSLNTPNELALMYQDFQGDRRVKIVPCSISQKSKAVHYSLKEGEIAGEAPNSGPFKYYWTLSLDNSPFPEELRVPEISPIGDVWHLREYYGHNANETALGELTGARGSP